MDHDSYGGFDPETKHITWCDDPECATTFELRRAHQFYQRGFNSWLVDSSTSIAEMIERDDADLLAELNVSPCAR